MAETTENRIQQHDEQDEEKTFEQLGLDPRLTRALIKKSIDKPTPIQRVAIPLILEGKDVVARAKTGSGKTFAYLLPLLQKMFAEPAKKSKLAPRAIVLVPTRELCQQVYSEVSSLVELCRMQLKVVQLSSSMHNTGLQGALAGSPDIIVSTPACIAQCLSSDVLQAKAINQFLEILILDEADLLLSYGYENDLKALTAHVPRRCQCLLMSATSSDDVEKLKKLVLHNPYILTLPEVGEVKDEIIPKNVQQFWIPCSPNDKLLYMLALLKLDLVQKKVLIFTNAIDTGFRLKLFLEKFGIKSAILNAELPQNSRLHILEEFNAGLFDYLIATDDSGNKAKEQAENNKLGGTKKSRKYVRKKLDAEFGVVRGIDFKNVHTVSPDETELFEEIKSLLGDDENKDVSSITEFPLLTENAVESLRYRAEDVGKSVTRVAIRESRAQDLRNEIINSEKLKAHFEVNPRDLDLLKHDKILSKNAPAHLREVPEYLLDPTTQEASKIVKLTRAAMGNVDPKRRQGAKRNNSKKSKNPLKSFSAEGRKKSSGENKRKGKMQDGERKQKKGKRY